MTQLRLWDDWSAPVAALPSEPVEHWTPGRESLAEFVARVRAEEQARSIRRVGARPAGPLCPLCGIRSLPGDPLGRCRQCAREGRHPEAIGRRRSRLAVGKPGE